MASPPATSNAAATAAATDSSALTRPRGPAPLAPAGGGRGGRARGIVPLFATTLACALLGLLALRLAVGPGFASPLNPAAGIALASVLVFGRRILVGVAIAAFGVAMVQVLALSQSPLALLATSATIALAVTAQTALAAVLIRRFVRWPLTLTAPVDVIRFLAACTVSSVVAPTVAAAALRLAGLIADGELARTWATWWIGDLAGLLVVAPIVLTLIGRPRSEWAPRRLSVGLTLTLATALLAFGIAQVGRWSEARLRESFVHDASSASLILVTQLQEPLRALEGLRGVYSVSRELNAAQLRDATENWLGGGAVRSMGWAEHAGHSEGDVITIRHVQPPSARSAAIGLDAMSIPSARVALLKAQESGRPAVGPDLFGEGGRSDPGSIAVFQAVYEGEPAGRGDRRGALRGMVFVTVGLEQELRALAGKIAPHLSLCLIDADPPWRRRLAGAPGCESALSAYVDERPLAYAGQRWDVRVSARPQDLPGAADRSAWVFSAVGLLSAAMLGAALLTTTGRTRRIESAVNERTAALRAEVVERQSAEQALRTSEARFRNIIDHVPIGVVYTDMQGRIIQANPRFCELTGYAESELTSLDPFDPTRLGDLVNDEAEAARLIAGEIAMYRRQSRFTSKAEIPVWVRSTVSLLRDADGRPWRIVAVVEDITEHLRLEEAEHARETAEAANQAKSDFLSRMSHELRTPLNAMLGFAQLLEIDRRHPLDAAHKPWVAQIQQAGWHLLEMINDVLDLSRIESGNLRLEMAPIDLPEIVAATASLVESDAARRGIRISRDLGPGTSVVLGDATRVKQILTNLLSNAVKYNIDSGRVHVASRVADDELVEISVTDTGLGMSAAQMDELFRPFNRLGRERSGMEGTGIGLVISRRLAEMMGGSIRVKSVQGEGSAFILRLPRALEADTIRSELDALGDGAGAYRTRVVHYIEDNETNVEVMRGILAQRPQVRMEVSVAGLDALAAIRAEQPHLILLDMHLPDISGLELLRHLKADRATAMIPVLVVSADATTQQIDAAVAAGAHRYLTKPVSVSELLAALDELLGRIETGFG